MLHTLEDLAGRWPEQNRLGLTEQLSGMLENITFAGGNLYEVARLGDDLAEHLIVLRLERGETAGMRLTYEWSPGGISLTRLDFKLDYTNELGLAMPRNAEAEACP